MIYDIIKTYGKGKGEDTMRRSVKALSDSLRHKLAPEDYNLVERDIYRSMAGGHYNEQFAKEDVEKMYYEQGGVRHYAPYWTDDQISSVYNNVKSELPSGYNLWDFYVAINMIKSDCCNLYKRWWAGASEGELEQKVVEATVNYFNDPDNPYGTEKVWYYLNS